MVYECILTEPLALSTGTGLYRNNYTDVKLFFEDYHRGHFKIYNLCSERAYPAGRFENKVALYPFDDHCAPTMDLVEDFCDDAAKWLGRHPKNVIAVHCKAGKGRTGAIICCLLMRLKLCATAVGALKQFGDLRTSDGFGVTIPSQIRYVHHFERFVKNEAERGGQLLKCRRLLQVVLRPSDHIADGAHINILQNGVLLYSTKGESLDMELQQAKREMTGISERTFEMDLVLCGDITLKLVQGGGVTFADRIFGISFNTAWIDDEQDWQLARTEIDGIHKPPKEKDKKNKKGQEQKIDIYENFAVILRMAPQVTNCLLLAYISLTI